MRYLFLDVETTGLDSIDNDVIEIGAIMYEDIEGSDLPLELGTFIGTLSADPMQDIDIAALQINGRTFSDIRGDKGMRESILEGFAEWLIQYVTKDTTIVGHNVKFDIDFIIDAGFRAKLDFTNILGKPTLDTKQIAAFLNDAGVLDIKNTRLVTVHNALFGLTNNENAHQALADALNTSDIYFKMRELV